MSYKNKSIVKTVKKYLKEKRINYKNLAARLEMSEANIKRMFTKGDVSISRLEQICFIIGISLSDLVLRSENDEKCINQMPIEIEEKLVENLELVLVLYLLVNNWKYSDIIDRFTFSEPHLTKLLVELDSLGVIEYLPNNVVKTKLSPQCHWQPNGPFKKFFDEKIKKEYFASNFNGKDDYCKFLSLQVSQESAYKIKLMIEEFENNVTALLLSDYKVPVKDKITVSMALTLSDWEYPIFNQYRKV